MHGTHLSLRCIYGVVCASTCCNDANRRAWCGARPLVPMTHRQCCSHDSMKTWERANGMTPQSTCNNDGKAQLRNNGEVH